MSGPPRLDAGTELELVAQLRAGDAMAFETLVRGHGATLLAVTRRLLRNEEDARDAVQEAFLSAFRSIESFQGTARLATWLHRIAVNCALMKLRSTRRRPEQSIEDLLPAFDDTGHHAEPPADWRRGSPPDEASALAERSETRDLVRAAIDQLPENYRIVLLLRDIEGLDTAETARTLGLTDVSVKVRLHRARQALRTILDHHFRGALA